MSPSGGRRQPSTAHGVQPVQVVKEACFFLALEAVDHAHSERPSQPLSSAFQKSRSSSHAWFCKRRIHCIGVCPAPKIRECCHDVSSVRCDVARPRAQPCNVRLHCDGKRWQLHGVDCVSVRPAVPRLKICSRSGFEKDQNSRVLCVASPGTNTPGRAAACWTAFFSVVAEMQLQWGVRWRKIAVGLLPFPILNQAFSLLSVVADVLLASTSPS